MTPARLNLFGSAFAPHLVEIGLSINIHRRSGSRVEMSTAGANVARVWGMCCRNSFFSAREGWVTAKRVEVTRGQKKSTNECLIEANWEVPVRARYLVAVYFWSSLALKKST